MPSQDSKTKILDQKPVGSRTGAVVLRSLLVCIQGFPPSCPPRSLRNPVSSSRHFARSVRICRTTRSGTLHLKSYAAYGLDAAFGASRE
jgi:hypothetical protein